MVNEKLRPAMLMKKIQKDQHDNLTHEIIFPTVGNYIHLFMECLDNNFKCAITIDVEIKKLNQSEENYYYVIGVNVDDFTNHDEPVINGIEVLTDNIDYINGNIS